MSAKYHDRLYADQMSQVSDFVFDEDTVRVFDDMVRRSIPGYLETLRQVGMLAKKGVGRGGLVFDLGCSTGAVTLVLGNVLQGRDCRIVAVDLSKPMIKRLTERLFEQGLGAMVSPVVGDVRTVKVADAHMVVMNFTLQFLKFEDKQGVLNRICRGLKTGGGLFISEKVRFDDPAQHGLVESLYFDFKRSNGYNDLEISQKRDALLNVLHLNTPTQLTRMLGTAGFSQVVNIGHQFNFYTFWAIK